MTTRKYSSRSQQTTLSGALTSSATTTTVVSGSSLLGGVTVSAGELFTVVIDPEFYPFGKRKYLVPAPKNTKKALTSSKSFSTSLAALRFTPFFSRTSLTTLSRCTYTSTAT